MVAYTYQLSLFSTVILLIIGFVMVLTLINWIQRLFGWLAGGNADRVSKSHDEKPTAENNDVPEEIDNIPDLEDKKGL